MGTIDPPSETKYSIMPVCPSRPVGGFPEVPNRSTFGMVAALVDNNNTAATVLVLVLESRCLGASTKLVEGVRQYFTAF